ncbi:TPA: hypothetical protein ACMDNX_002013 [Vibrio cholerae]
MATVIRLKGVNFNNPSLPVIAPLVRTGLRAAWRPANGMDSLVDLSGNGKSLTVLGNPSFTQNGVKGDRSNGLLTDLIETTSYTYIAVGRIPDGIEASSQQSMLVNNFKDDDADVRGGSVWLMTGNIRYTSSYYKSGEGVNNQANSILGTAQGIGNDWQFIVVQIDATTQTQRVYTPTIKGNMTPDERQGWDFAARTIYADQPLALVAVPYDRWSSASQSELGEVLVYDRALSAEEIQRQYELSKTFWKNHRGIDI